MERDRIGKQQPEPIDVEWREVEDAAEIGCHQEQGASQRRYGGFLGILLGILASIFNILKTIFMVVSAPVRKKFSFKKQDPKDPTKTVPNYANITDVWRAINWLLIWLIDWKFISVLFKMTPIRVLSYIAPGVPWETALVIIAFFISAIIAFLASRETNKDDFRFASGVILSVIPVILMLLTGQTGVFSIIVIGCLVFSVYAEKIYTDKNVRRTPPRKVRRELHKDENGNIIFDEYNV